MYKIVIVGAGQLGSRHLQGVLRANLQASIEVVDPNSVALENAKKRVDEISYEKNSKSIAFLTCLTAVSKHIDLCIVASTANVRFNIIQTLVSVSTIRFLILEKILFQDLDQYDLTQELLAKNGIQTWVNCPRRMVPEYKALQSRINTNEPISFVLLGSNWGLGCNAIHFIDLFTFFTGNHKLVFNTDRIHKIIPAKREGFYELVGTLSGSQQNNAEIVLQSKEQQNAFISISILTGTFYCTINEIKGLMTIMDTTSQQTEDIKISIPLQSQLTIKICEDLLLRGHCDLTSYPISSLLHKQLLSSYVDVFERNGFSLHKSCPIT
jgi:Oxidoreductase family, NAD-binding Rossmann fold